MFKSCRRSSFSDFLVVWVFESMHIVGVSLLFFVVLPELDVVKGAMLTNCLCFIPAVLGTKNVTFSLSRLLFLLRANALQMCFCIVEALPVLGLNMRFVLRLY